MADYSAPVGAPTWFDLMSEDPAAAAGFYCGLFGWAVEAPPEEEFGGYQNFTKNGKRVAGISPVMEDAGPPNVWSVYLHTADAAATAAAVDAAGGSVIVPPMAIGDEGTMLFALDSAGAAIGFWQPGAHLGFTEWGTHGTPYWFECHSKSYAASLDFYRAVTGVRPQEVGTGGDPDAVGPDAYAQLMTADGDSYSGIMDSVKLFPSEVPSFWQVYICVDDVAATVDRVAELGGKVLMGGEDTPFGTLASATDPFGAVFALGSPPAGM